MKLKELKALFRLGYKVINRISLWRYLRYLIFGLAAGTLIFSWFSRMPDLGTRNYEHIKTNDIRGCILMI